MPENVANLQKFYVARVKQIKKWALLSWTWLSKHVKEGGLGLRDPYILNQVMGEKLWGSGTK